MLVVSFWLQFVKFWQKEEDGAARLGSHTHGNLCRGGAICQLKSKTSEKQKNKQANDEMKLDATPQRKVSVPGVFETLKQQLSKLARKQINKQTNSNLANKQMKVCKSE